MVISPSVAVSNGKTMPALRNRYDSVQAGGWFASGSSVFQVRQAAPPPVAQRQQRRSSKTAPDAGALLTLRLWFIVPAITERPPSWSLEICGSQLNIIPIGITDYYSAAGAFCQS